MIQIKTAESTGTLPHRPPFSTQLLLPGEQTAPWPGVHKINTRNCQNKDADNNKDIHVLCGTLSREIREEIAVKVNVCERLKLE